MWVAFLYPIRYSRLESIWTFKYFFVKVRSEDANRILPRGGSFFKYDFFTLWAIAQGLSKGILKLFQLFRLQLRGVLPCEVQVRVNNVCTYPPPNPKKICFAPSHHDWLFSISLYYESACDRIPYLYHYLRDWKRAPLSSSTSYTIYHRLPGAVGTVRSFLRTWSRGGWSGRTTRQQSPAGRLSHSGS